jgi:hypothetical protein
MGSRNHCFRSRCAVRLLCLLLLFVPSVASSAEILFSDPALEISGSGAFRFRTCTIILKPALSLGDVRAPRLKLTPTISNDLSFALDDANDFKRPVLVQNNLRRPIAEGDLPASVDARRRLFEPVVRAGKVFFITAQRVDTGLFVSSRYERIDYDAILRRIEANCPFDAEALMTDLTPREKAEKDLAIPAPDLTLMRWALNKTYAGSSRKPEPALSLSAQERLYLKRYEAENGLPITRFLTAETARRLKLDGLLISSSASPAPSGVSLIDVARRAILEYYAKHGVEGGAPVEGVADLYPPEFLFFNKIRSRADHLSQLRDYDKVFEFLRFRVVESSLSFDRCLSPSNCVVKGRVESSLRKAANPEAGGSSARFVIGFDLRDGIKVISECSVLDTARNPRTCP